MPVLFGLAASLLVGISDTLGRFTTRRATAVSQVATAMIIGVPTAALVAVVAGHDLIGSDLARGLASGLLLSTALAVMYRGMADSSAAIVSPLAAVFAALVPLTWDIVRGLRPNAVVLAGCAVAVAALALTTFNPDIGEGVRRGLALGVVAGALFGASIIFVGETSDASGAWPAAAQRLMGTVTMIAVARAQGAPVLLPRSLMRLGLLSGAVGTVGIVFLTIGAQRGDLGIVSVAGSMFPAVVAVLSALFDDDQLRWWQLVGIGAAVGGMAMIALG
ncbi:MAG: EamA family transporter [Acidimicrobiales bacterium]